MIVWLEDRLQPVEAARIDPRDRGLLLADGVFETMRLAHGAAPWLADHLARLADGAARLAIPLPAPDWPALIAALAAANQLTDGVVRITLTRGVGGRGVTPPAAPTPTLLVTAMPASPPPETVRLITARSTLRHHRSPTAAIKTLAYLDGILARQEALAAGADDALLANPEGRIAESTAATLIIARGGRWTTPPLADGALPGLARKRLCATGAVTEQSLPVGGYADITAAVLVNALGCSAITSIDSTVLPPGQSQEMASRIRAFTIW